MVPPFGYVDSPWADTTTSINVSNVKFFERVFPLRDIVDPWDESIYSPFRSVAAPWYDTHTSINASNIVM